MKQLSKRIIVLIIFQLVFTLPQVLNAADRSKIKDGVKAFQKEQWDESLNKFQDALVDDPTNPLLHFNVGDVNYKKKNYEEALKSFEKTLNTNDVSLQQQAYYNMGNSYYQMNKYQEAIDYYKEALELNPNDLDAKYNLELVRAKIKEMAKKQPMDNQQQQQQGDQKQQQQGSDNQQQNEQQQNGENENENEQNQQEKGKQQTRAEQQNQEQKQAGKPEEKKELTKEQAEQILRSLRSKEEGNKKLRPMPPQSGKVRVEKDW
jgi:Ca-activated chloride channel family protein